MCAARDSSWVSCSPTPLAPRVQQAAQDAGLLVNAAAPDVVRLAPPLIIDEDVADALLRTLPGVLDAARGAH